MLRSLIAAATAAALPGLKRVVQRQQQLQQQPRRLFSIKQSDGSSIPGATLPHGGILKNLIATGDELLRIKAESLNLKSYTLTEQQLCDIELILNGGMSPLEGFMDENNYNRVVDTMRLADGILFPLPITLDVSGDKVSSDSKAKVFEVNKSVALRDPEGDLLAVLDITSIYKPDRVKEALQVFGVYASLLLCRGNLAPFYCLRERRDDG